MLIKAVSIPQLIAESKRDFLNFITHPAMKNGKQAIAVLDLGGTYCKLEVIDAKTKETLIRFDRFPKPTDLESFSSHYLRCLNTAYYEAARKGYYVGTVHVAMPGLLVAESEYPDNASKLKIADNIKIGVNSYAPYNGAQANMQQKRVVAAGSCPTISTAGKTNLDGVNIATLLTNLTPNIAISFSNNAGHTARALIESCKTHTVAKTPADAEKVAIENAAKEKLLAATDGKVLLALRPGNGLATSILHDGSSTDIHLQRVALVKRQGDLLPCGQGLFDFVRSLYPEYYANADAQRDGLPKALIAEHLFSRESMLKILSHVIFAVDGNINNCGKLTPDIVDQFYKDNSNERGTTANVVTNFRKTIEMLVNYFGDYVNQIQAGTIQPIIPGKPEWTAQELEVAKNIETVLVSGNLGRASFFQKLFVDVSNESGRTLEIAAPTKAVPAANLCKIAALDALKDASPVSLEQVIKDNAHLARTVNLR